MLKELKGIITEQKTITTKRLKPYVDRMSEAFLNMNKRNHKLEIKLAEMNRMYQVEKTKHDKLLKKYKELKGRV